MNSGCDHSSMVIGMSRQIFFFPFIFLFFFNFLVDTADSHDKVVVIPLTKEKVIEPSAPLPAAKEIPNSAYRPGVFTFTTIDNVTGLEWQRVDDNTLRNWESALLYCSTLEFGNYQDWRLPSISELQSLVDYREAYPAINSTAFPNTDKEKYWSSTNNSTLGNRGYTVDFEAGSIETDLKSVGYYVRCVRNGQEYNSNGPYQVNENGTVTDISTGLVWQRGSESNKSYSFAVSYCDNLPLAGGGWRLPNVKELFSIRDHRLRTLMVDANAFPNSSSFLHWTTTSYYINGSKAWTILFNSAAGSESGTPTGWVRAENRTSGYHVRCVR